MAGVEDLAGGTEFCNVREFTVDVDDRDEEDSAWVALIVLRSIALVRMTFGRPRRMNRFADRSQ